MKTTAAEAEKGFTLMELVISMTVFLIATAAIFGALRIASIQKSTTGNRTEQLRSARIALEYIRRDTLNAGLGYQRTGGNVPDGWGVSLFGFPADADVERDWLVSIFGGNDLTNNSLNPGKKMDFIGMVSRDQTFNNGELVNYVSTGTSGNSVFVKTKTGQAANCKANDLYLIEDSNSGTTQVIAMATAVANNDKITLAVNDPLGVNQSATATGENKNLLTLTSGTGETEPSGTGTIKKINLVTYGISSDGVLVRKAFGNQGTSTDQIEVRELVYGVTDFQIKYFMEDGTIAENPSNNNNGRINQLEMNDVVQVQISISIMPVGNDGQQNPKTPLTLQEFISTKNLRYQLS